MVEKEVEDYIKTQKSLGVSDHDIRKSLVDAGYHEDEFSRELARHAGRSPASAGKGWEKGFTPTVKHILYLNVVIVVMFGAIVSYLAYDYNTKLSSLSAEQDRQADDMGQKLTTQEEALKGKIDGVERSLSGELGVAKSRIENVNTDLQTKVDEYKYQSMSRDSALSDSIQKMSNKSLTELSMFEEQLETFREASVDFSPVIPKAIETVVTVGRKDIGYFTTTGSGVLINEKGYIVTNYHVVDDLRTINVKTHDGGDYLATLVGKVEEWDIAVIKLITEKSNFEYMEWADSSQVSVGDHVIAVGNPVGFESTVTEGIISNTKRLIPTNDLDIYYFQTDVAINAGNSGGPLIDKGGKIVGIATLKYSAVGYEGLSFALRANEVKAKVLEILQKEV
jgi:S1-C subfamily serine protease